MSTSPDPHRSSHRFSFGWAAFAVAAVWVALTAAGAVLDLVQLALVLGLVGVGAVVAFQVVRGMRASRAATPASVRTNQTHHGGTTMWKSLKRWWKYLAVKLRVLHEEKADPKVQL